MRVHVTEPRPGNWEHHALIDLGHVCDVLSSAAFGGGFRQARYTLNRSVHRAWNPPDPLEDMRRYLTDLNIPPDGCVGLMTAVGMAELQRREAEEGNRRVTTLVTAGVSNAAAAGRNTEAKRPVATINIIVVVGGRLVPAGLVAAVQTVTEAKALALWDCGITTAGGERASGTTTDTVVNYLARPCSPYAGPATIPGYLIAKTVRAAVEASVKRESL